ncbi:hypothetical protein CDD82_848 [Ophiocordyceps australis]|uniref:Uncharacterized protein n=1 Tax=Ophiocordyceps australis TaxID=1399860 RepID=A0A2C5ZN25_9HYPO|nr:hypothetical protein CDD82_848 [Ophiocordyceps australis]
MPRQRTFSVLPPIAAAAPLAEPTRPMTSKQVNKAYRAATRMPPLPRQERLRQERAEQARIRLELDRESASRRARAARQRKKEKEAGERARKKRERQPVVDVRPSQDTIARFVRGEGSTTKSAARDVVPRLDASGHARQKQDEPDLHPCLEERQPMIQHDKLETEMLEPNATAFVQHSQPRVATPSQSDLAPCNISPGPPAAHQDIVPPSTQAILNSADDFFPSASQLELELRNERAADASPAAMICPPHQTPAPAPSAPPRSSPHSLTGIDSTSQHARDHGAAPGLIFFTGSGSQELMSLAMQRSRRCTNLQDWRCQTHLLQGGDAEAGCSSQGQLRNKNDESTTTRGSSSTPQTRALQPGPRQAHNPPSNCHKPHCQPLTSEQDKENALPFASQESEYGGAWVDEVALDLAF